MNRFWYTEVQHRKIGKAATEFTIRVRCLPDTDNYSTV